MGSLISRRYRQYDDPYSKMQCVDIRGDKFETPAKRLLRPAQPSSVPLLDWSGATLQVTKVCFEPIATDAASHTNGSFLLIGTQETCRMTGLETA